MLNQDAGAGAELAIVGHRRPSSAPGHGWVRGGHAPEHHLIEAADFARMLHAPVPQLQGLLNQALIPRSTGRPSA